MKLLRILSLTAVLFTFSNACIAQSKVAIEKQLSEWEKQCQDCIDAGTNNFVSCETIFYKKVDGALNAVYKDLKKQFDSTKFKELKLEQLSWLKKRDAFFKKQDSAVGQSGAGIEADQAMALHQKALYVEERIKVLLKKLNK